MEGRACYCLIPDVAGEHTDKTMRYYIMVSAIIGAQSPDECLRVFEIKTGRE